MDKFEILRLEVGKLELKPGDILVLRSSEPLSMATRDNLKNNLDKVLPNSIKSIVLADPILEFQVIRHHEEDPDGDPHE